MEAGKGARERAIEGESGFSSRLRSDSLSFLPGFTDFMKIDGPTIFDGLQTKLDGHLDAMKQSIRAGLNEFREIVADSLLRYYK
jgi:hypothetical protein